MMPIKRLQAERPAAFPCIGKLRKGGAKQTNAKGKEVMGRDLDHFRFTSDDADASAAFTAYYGAEPKAIKVFLPYASADENFQAWMEEYRAGGLVRRCDGETCVFSRDAQGRALTAPTACALQCACKQVGRLAVIIPELVRLAYGTVETHSVYDIIQLTENLQAPQALRGDLRGIPFVLARREREISTPTGDGGRARRKKSLLFIEPDPEWVSRQLESMRIAALPLITTDLPAISTPRMLVDRDSGEIIDTGWGDSDEGDVDDDNPFDDVAAPTPLNSPFVPPVATVDDATLQRVCEMAEAVYGDRWDLDKEHQVAQGASKGVAHTLRELTQKEAERLLKIFVSRLSNQAPAKEESNGS